MKSLQDIYTTHESIIDTLISQKAMFDSEWQKMMQEIMEKLDESDLRYLDVVKEVKSLLRWTIQMLLNNNAIIKNYQQFVLEVQENVDVADNQFREYEDRLAELQEINEELRTKIGRLTQELELARDRLHKGVVATESQTRMPPAAEEEERYTPDTGDMGDDSYGLEEEEDQHEQEPPEPKKKSSKRKR